MESFEVIVIGAGAMGSAAAFHSAQSGHSTLLIEQFEIGHERGASHGQSRIIRKSYEHAQYCKLAKFAYDDWRQLEAVSGEKLLHITGGLDYGPPGDPGIGACMLSMQQERIPFEQLTTDEIKERFPQFRIDDGVIGIYQNEAGILDATHCVKTMVKTAAKLGATVKDNTVVEKLELTNDECVVHTTNGSFKSKKLIVCAGPWSSPFLERHGVFVPITVTKEQIAFFKPQKPELFELGKFPVFIDYTKYLKDADCTWYGFPIFGLPGVKTAMHRFGPVTTADTRNFEIEQPQLEELKRRMQKFLPDAYGDIIYSTTCLYALTPDRDFVVDFMPGYGNVVIGAGFSGHGFKFSISIGRMLNDFLHAGRTDLPHNLFWLGRFSRVRL